MNQNALAAQIIIDIINKEMEMPPNRVWLRDQEKEIPNDDDLFIVAGIITAPTICSESEMISQLIPGSSPPAFQQTEVNSVLRREDIQIDVCSKSNAAIFRNWEVIAALQSFYAQQRQGANFFKICRIPREMINTSSAEGGSFVNRYTLTFSCFVWYRKSRALTPLNGNYYDSFPVRADDEQTIGTNQPLAEFTEPPS